MPSRPKAKKTHSLKRRIALVILLLVFIQGLVLVFSITLAGTIGQTTSIIYNNLANQVHNRGREVQEDLNNKRRNMSLMASELNYAIEEVLSANNASMRGLDVQDALFQDILETSLEHLVEFTKFNQVTGVFVVIDPTNDVANPERLTRSAVYIRDSSPHVTARDNSNLFLEYGPVDMARNRGIALNYLWRLNMRFDGEFYRDFYFKPINAFLDAPDNALRSRIYAFGFWSPPFAFKRGDMQVITYSLPLVLNDGTVYGVAGFELSLEFVRGMLPVTEIPFGNGMYLLGIDGGGALRPGTVVASGAHARQFLLDGDDYHSVDFGLVYEAESAGIYEIVNERRPVTALGAISHVQLYETFSPFHGETWVLIGMSDRDIVLAAPRGLRDSIALSISVTILFGIISTAFAVMIIFRPIKNLVKTVEGIDPKNPVDLGKSGLKEIDELSAAFENLSGEIALVAAKMFRIIELVDLPLGSFEINSKENSVLFSHTLFELFGNTEPAENTGRFAVSTDIGVWNEFFKPLVLKRHEQNGSEGYKEAIYTVEAKDKNRWLRVRSVTEDFLEFGIVADITTEIENQIKLEFERDHDPLTLLFNRTAFKAKTQEIINQNIDKVGLMMFADLDDLKFVNDVYGHDIGDSYIRTFADFISVFNDIGGIVSRFSGDEFVMFMTGYNSREEAKAAFDSRFDGLFDKRITTRDGSELKIRASVGISFYPFDSTDIGALISYADYAMYEIKHTVKGTSHEFNLDSYKKNSFVMTMKGLLDEFIDERQCYYVFQPIVDAKTGEVFAYEALMRSSLDNLKSPGDVLKLARAQSKLYQIEKLTFQTVFTWIRENAGLISGRKIFINSIPNQVFTAPDMESILESYGDLFKYAVFEITENEFSVFPSTVKKIADFRERGGMIAIDDYGSGYSNELSLLKINPEFIKIDMNLVRDINKDSDKFQLVSNIILYAAERNIKTIAEGIETHEELRTLMLLGIDYAQGYLLGKPQREICDIPEHIKNMLAAK